MKNLYHRILDLMNLNGRDWVIFLLTLLLAFSIWLLHNLSLRYSDDMKIQILAHCDIPGRSDVATEPVPIMIRCNATGYRLIESYLNRNDMIDVTFKPSEMKHLKADIYYVTQAEVMQHMGKMFGSEVEVETFHDDTLFFTFPLMNHKKVPVYPVTTFTFKDQYMPEKDLVLKPDSVVIYGEPYVLNSVNSVNTRQIRAYDISKNLRGVTQLENIPNVRISEKEVHYSLEVKRFVEIRSRMSIKAVNVPENKHLLIWPSYVDVTFNCVYPLKEDPVGGLELEVDYDDFLNSISGKCKVHLPEQNSGIISYKIDPPYVSCRVEDLQ